MASSLPVELWLQIFAYAAGDEPFLDRALPTSLSPSAWVKMLDDRWALRSPYDQIELSHKKSYATKKAIISTCRTWHAIGTEFLFTCLFFDDPTRLLRICPTLENEKSLGLRTRRIHISRFYAGFGTTLEETRNALVSVIKHCPNLEIFIITWPISNALFAVGDALCTYCRRSLRSLHLSVPTAATAKAILLLDSLPALISVHFDFDGPPPETTSLGSTSNVTLRLTLLRQLSLRGPFQEFLEQAIGWDIPALQGLSLDFLGYREDLPDITEFLTNHGSHLIYLDINCVPALDVPTILDLCPNLTTFLFNPDWRIPSTDGEFWGEGSLVHRPHQNITTIGLHQLLFAFGVGDNVKLNAIDPATLFDIQHRNDSNFAALNKRDFPRLERIRLVNRTLLRDLDAADGPQEEGYTRWERWWDQSTSQGVRLEDCTAELLGNLPVIENDESDNEDGSGDGGQSFDVAELQGVLEMCRQIPEVDDEYWFGSEDDYLNFGDESSIYLGDLSAFVPQAD